jgi:tetratricopeptide (TPR) repeat protein
MNIEAIKEAWFYDDITTRGVSFDGFLPQACKTPLGNMLLGNTPEFELIHTPEQMADFQNSDWYRKNWKLGDTMLTFSPLQPDKHILVDAYRKEMAKILSFPCDSECCEHDASCGAWPTRGSCRGMNTLCEDVSRYGDVMTGNNVLDDGKIYDVKKEIYRLTDRVFAALAKCYEVDASGTFAILNELYRMEIISLEARDDFASASAIAIKLRISTYLKAGKQGEQFMPNSNEETGKLTSVCYMPNNEELFHFFFIAIPLYEELQKFKAAGIPPSLLQSSFFDESDATMGHIFCRLLKYKEAVECYNRALQQDPENLSIEIRRISIALCITKGTEEMDKIRENLDILLCKIDQSWSEPHQETTAFVNRLDFQEIRQLLEVLPLASSFFDCPKYFELAGNILFQNLAVDGSEYSARRELLMMVIAFARHLPESSDQQHIVDSVTSEMTFLLDKEGVSTKSILWLNRLGEFLFEMRKIDKAYRCFQRALSMERLLYQTKPNINTMTSLYFLGLTSFYLAMYRESKFYNESLVQLFESFGGPNARLMVKIAYFQLGLMSYVLGNSAEESVCYLEKGLKATTAGSRNDKELRLDCILYCQLATTWHAQHNQEQAWESALDGKACLRKIVGVQERVNMACLLVDTLAKIQKTNEGIEMLEEEVQELTSQSQTEEKALCLMKLGKLCFEQGLASDAENYYKQALEVMVDMQDNKNIFDILECRIGISKAIMMDNRVSEAKIILDQAFILAKKLHASLEKMYFVQDMGKFCENIGYISRARECFDEALRTYKELSNVAKKPPFMEVSFELKLGKLAKNACIIDLANPEIAMQAQRSHYDRAAEALRQHLATGQVNSLTVDMFLQLAVEYKSVDLSEAIRRLLETLNVSEMVYGKNKSNETVIEILEELSDAYTNTGDLKASIKCRELLISKEMDLYLSNPFRESISQNLILLATGSFAYPVGIDTVERAYEFILSAQKDKAPTESTAKTATARCFTCLGILFYNLGDLEKAETVNEMASQLFSEIQESVEREKLPFKTTCDIMKEILPSKTISLFDVIKLSDSIAKAFVALRRQDTSTAEDSKTSENCSNGRGNVELFIPSSDGVKPREIDFSDPKTIELLTQTISQINLPVELESFPDDASLNPGLSNLEVKRLFQLDALEHNRKIGNVHQAAKIHASLQADELSFYESSPFDAVDKLISDAIRAKEDNRLSSGIRSLDIALQLLSNWRRKTKILKLRGECYLFRGDFRNAAINFNEAVCVYSSETVGNRDDLCEYSEVAIGLIKTEMLCQNVAGAWVECQEAIELVFNHEHSESVHLQAIELLYLEAKCLDILSDSAESKDDKIALACSLCQQANFILSQTTNAVEQAEEHGSSGAEKFLALKSEVQLLLAAIFRKLHKEEEAGKILEEMEEFFINIADKFEFLECGRLFSWIGRVLVMRDKIKRSITWLSKSLLAFFSAALPDMLTFYEEFLPLLQAITVTKSSGTSHESRSPFQQALDMCKEVSVKHGNDLHNVYEFLKTLANLYMGLGRTEEAIVVAETGLEICDLMGDNNVTDRINNRGRMLLYLAQMHQLNSTNSAFDRNKELNLAERYYLTDQDSAAEFVLQKNLSYANFLCEQKRFAEADTVLRDMNKLGKDLSDKFVYCAYFSRVFYGSGIQKSVEVDGELLSTVEHCMYSTMVRVFVGMGKKTDAVAACEKLTANPIVVHDTIHEKRPSSIPYLIEVCHRELLSLLSDEDQKQLQNCEFPLSPANIFKLYYMLNEYTLALKYYTDETQSPDMIEMCNTMFRVFVEMGKKREAVSACEKLTANPVVVHDAIHRKPPSSIPYLIEACHRELLSLLSDEDRKQLQNCELPLSPANIFKLYYMLNEYTLALKYYTNETLSPHLIEMKISCLCLAGNELVEMGRGDESDSYFTQFIAMLQTKEGFLDKPFHAQCATLARYSSANQYYIFRSLGRIMERERGNLDGATQCYERCLELDADLSLHQDLVATLNKLYRSKALTGDIENQDSCKRLMSHALDLFQELFQEPAELSIFEEWSFGSRLLELERYHEAVEHFENVIKRADDEPMVYTDVDKPSIDVYLRREIETSGSIIIPVKVHAFYELILAYMKLNEVGKAQEVALGLENYVERFQLTPEYSLVLSTVGYANKLTGNKQKAAEIFVLVLEINPGHLPVTEALESLCV